MSVVGSISDDVSGRKKVENTEKPSVGAWTLFESRRALSNAVKEGFGQHLDDALPERAVETEAERGMITGASRTPR